MAVCNPSTSCSQPAKGHPAIVVLLTVASTTDHAKECPSTSHVHDDRQAHNSDHAHVVKHTDPRSNQMQEMTKDTAQ
eukprot:279711-Amphidinium_carterae.1